MTPAHLRISGIDVHGQLCEGRGRITLHVAPDEWPGFRLGTRVRVVRGVGVDGWYTVAEVLPLPGLLAVALHPTDPPPAERAYWPPVKGGPA